MSYYHYGTTRTNAAGHLEIGGVDTLALAKDYGTPLFVYDTALIKERIQQFKEVFETAGVAYKVTYASKAFTAIAMYQLLAQAGVGCDVVSGGEIYTANQAGFNMADVSFHGNNKSAAELELALETGVGTIVLDNFHEIDLLNNLLEERQQQVNVLLRVSPGISAHTHEYIMTGQEDSKFGFDLKSGQATAAFEKVRQLTTMKLLGVHCHIGSQIFETKGFEMAAGAMVDLLNTWKQKDGFQAAVLNLGGGFGVRYTAEDHPLAPQDYVKDIVAVVKKLTSSAGLKLPAIWIEPGRSMVAEAGTTLYTVGSRKDLAGIRSYLALDGGMGDNIRPALYQAKYDAVLASDPDGAATQTVSLAGKYCESGDMLAWDQQLPTTQPGDVVAMFTTGAYGYSMASNYNRNPRPAVVFVENGHAQLVVKRESFADLVHLDLPLK
ncbi:diaminopimelate decarboxylase [Loigolactobacillus backii]|uniref:diaminopimelate decarboxylase n=1 Tax=Loigolactobacillus backii TaxID=375175 RepID=UPI0007F0BDF8|nr:diaminopimelate decarboxylase [Loigolactobacillus backii]ANK59415.1 diaminopimelate decarboxylase [Loigolactobacillus backii]ANK64409.1 diaminopimelate decarboxylase [Loigolactobacillus backii]ANK67197.1 diaminopimelate decarboxylase [Loigolactobacillus backii]OLF69438.1 diaminopimelate decarboxylase [Loigolactobacillus backii]PIO87841.1 diaminopimelate decarboxylase [Loigolactobacillus backii]